MLSEHTRALLLRTLAGRAFLAGAAVKLLLAVLRAVVALPAVFDIVDALATVAILVAVLVFGLRLAGLARRRLLWRVRRKLILSYIFMGVVPAALIASFFLLGLFLLFQNLSSYLFRDGYDDLLENVRLMSRTTAVELSRMRDVGRNAGPVLERRRANLRQQYPEMSLAVVPTASPMRSGGVPEAASPLVAGPWRHVGAPESVPEWVIRRGGFAGTLAVVAPDDPEDEELVLRSVELLEGLGAGHAVIVDLPLDGQVVEELREKTGIRAGDISIRQTDRTRARPLLGRIRGTARKLVRPGETQTNAAEEEAADAGGVLSHSVAFLDFVDWESGEAGRASVSMNVTPQDLWMRISAAQPVRAGTMSFGEILLFIFVVVAALLIIIQLVALAMGVALARSITSSVHELFTGTERVRQGDFTHRIAVKAQDQLGELAISFNQMTESIEHLLQTEAEKKRLEEELRIAREIQMSLLPRGVLSVPGLEVTALCVPAREVGGDYYDFFPLGDRRVAVLVADVSGKGTSAALYMAELKGLLLSLSQRHQSPKDLLIEVNRILSDNLDTRSFITMTYGVIDLREGTMTYARAGHTPLIYLPAHGAGRGTAQVLQPNGLVLGLRIDGIHERFVQLLEEDTIEIGTGDLFVLYTDGVTEAMNADAELFGEARLSRIVEEHGHLRSAELRERILREVESFVGPADQHDDLTLILVKVSGAGAAELRAAG
jgi:sigma-B regulation protein RsbU (phosphoserine phosphatase)